MQAILFSALWGAMAGLSGTSAGALLGGLLKPKARLLSLLFELSGGIMLAMICFELLPRPAAEIGLWPVLLYAGAGIFLVGLLRKLPLLHGTGEKRTAGVIALGLAIHNLPEGLAIGSALHLGAAGVSLAAAVALHDIPEGLVLALPYKKAGEPSWKAILLAVLSGLPTVLGSVIGYGLGGFSATLIPGCMAFAGGAMLYVVCREMLQPDSGFSGWGMIMGVLLGLVMITLLE